MRAEEDAMKGDYSRISFNPRKHYSAVLQQQGRVQLDADWNEQAEIDAHRHRTLTRDVIGACGAPSDGGGFEVSVRDDGEIAISAGRLYVAGTLCRLEAETTYSQQPDLPRPPEVPRSDGQTLVVYLDVWERHVTAFEDPDIRDPALGGPDTTTRKRTVAQVKLLASVAGGDCEQQLDGFPPPPSGGRLAARIERKRDGGDKGPGPGFAGTENKLYRVEIHESGALGTATFKWSRDNGSAVHAVREFLADEPQGGLTPARVEALAADGTIDLSEGDWVELLGEESELSLVPGAFVRVARVQERERVVWLEGELSDQREESRPKLRRWDGEAGPQTVDPGWHELEDGVSIRLSGGPFMVGDWWVIPARPGHGSAELPPEPPRGIEHGYCRLALLTWQKKARGRWGAAVRDCRPLFEPLAGVAHERCSAEIAHLRGLLESQARELGELRKRLSH